MGSFTTITPALHLLLLLFCTVLLVHSGPLFSEFLSPNFTTSHYQNTDNTPYGAFLVSRNGTFTAAISNPNPHPEDKVFYLCVLHTPSNTIVWSANRNAPISQSAKLRLTVDGLTITDDAGQPIWSTTPLHVPAVSLLQLQESGNLVLLDRSNATLWASFDHPTDTIVVGQKLPVGQSIVGASSEDNFTACDYRFTVTGDDAMLQWNGLTYWKLSMDTQAFKETKFPISYMGLKSTNGTKNASSGLYLFGNNGSAVVFQVELEESDSFRIAKLGSDGQFVVQRVVEKKWVQEFTGPVDNCRIPSVCGKIGLCWSGKCSCPVGFQGPTQMGGGELCRPSNTSYSLPSACDDSQSNSPSISYVGLGEGMDYFANDFTEPAKHGVNLSVCQDLCSQNCSCLGIFHGNSSGSCYLLQNHLGSITNFSSPETDRLGFIKTLVVSSSPNPNGDEDKKGNFPIAGLVLLPSSGFFLLVTLLVIGILWYRRKKRRSRNGVVKLGRTNSSSSGELETFSISGLPVRFDYEELATATDKFSTQIGSGGFGTVYKGTLLDKTVVAVKKITSLGVQGKKEFSTEIAIIGNIRHVNLVRLKGFCAHKRQMFLVYEYMNVYSYGMVLLEIVRGQRNWRLQIVSQSTENDSSCGNGVPSSSVLERRPVSFPRFALEMHEQRRYLELADPRLEGRVTSKEVEKLVRVALCCVQAEPLLRPSMAEVVGMLEGTLSLHEQRVNGSTNSNTGVPHNAYSYLSSQQLSGPR